MCVSSVTSEIYMYTFACFIQILLFLFIKLFLNTYIMKLFIYLVYYTYQIFFYKWLLLYSTLFVTKKRLELFFITKNYAICVLLVP